MTPIVSAIVTHHLPENQPYLDLCLSSLMAQEGIDLEVHCVSDALRKPDVPRGTILHHRPELDNATKKVHWARDVIHDETKYLLLVGDDVMLSKRTVEGLVAGSAGHHIVNPLSNNELGGRFLTEMTLTHDRGHEMVLRNNMSRQELYGFENAVLNYPARPAFLIPVPWVSFFCTLIPVDLFDKLGGLDERLETRHNDQDFCMRAAHRAAASFLNLGVFALHFGGKTLPLCTAPDDLTQATEYFNEKWPQQ